MPGVPPDTVAQVKKGLRGLFKRRKSKESKPLQSQPEPTSTSSYGGTTTTTAAAAAPATAAGGAQGSKNRDSPLPPPPQSASTDLNKAPQLSAPAQVEEANAIDLNPSIRGAEEQPSRAVTEPSTKATTELSTGLTEPSTKATTELSSKPNTVSPPRLTETTTGMSATSGPLGDHMEEGYVDDDEVVGAKGETLAKSEKMKNADGGEKI